MIIIIIINLVWLCVFSALTTYVYVNVTSCDNIESDLLQMLYVLCAVYAVIFLACVMVAVLALLAYRTERLHKRHLEVWILLSFLGRG